VSRQHLRILLVGALLIGAPLFFYKSSERVSLDTVLDISRLTGKALPDLLQRIRGFHRVVTRDGKKLLEVSAKEAAYFRDDTAVQILEPKLLFFDDGEQVGSIAGNRGRLVLDGNDVDNVQLTGAVRVVLTQFEIRAEDIIYERKRDLIIATGAALVQSDEVVLKGANMTFDLAAKSLTVDQSVDMTLRQTRVSQRHDGNTGAAR
jgi:LPS export ABC transporter protein LptC